MRSLSAARGLCTAGGLAFFSVLQDDNSSNIENRMFMDVRFKNKCDTRPELPWQTQSY